MPVWKNIMSVIYLFYASVEEHNELICLKLLKQVVTEIGLR